MFIKKHSLVCLRSSDKALILALAVSALPMFAQAHSNPSEDGIYYKSADDKIKDAQSCIISSGGGAGSTYTNIKMNNCSYPFKGRYRMNDKCDYRLNGKSVTSYVRNGIFHKRIS